MIEYEMKPYAGPCPLYNGMWVASVKLKGFLNEEAFESVLDKAGYHNVYENVYERQAIYDKVFMSYIMRGYKVSVRGAGCFYPYIKDIPFKPDKFDVVRAIPKVYVCREPEKMLCKEISITEKDLKRYEEEKAEEGALFG